MRYAAWSFGIATLLGACMFAACSKDEESPTGGLGDSCDPSEEGSCREGLVCPEDSGICAYAAGSACDSEIDDGGCAPGLECREIAEGETTCVVPTGSVCDRTLENGGCALSDECTVPEPLVLMPAPDLGAGGAAPDVEGNAGGAHAGEVEPLCLTREGEECDPAEEHCTNGLVCAEMDAGGDRCFPPVVLRGTVTDTTDGEPIESAHVIAIDDEGVAVSDVAVTGADGAYALPVPVAREEDGSPIDATFTLRAGAQDYQLFPSGIRVALPISTTEAESADIGYVIESALTEVGLIPLPAGERYWISGDLSGLTDESQVGGVLVLAVGDEGAFSAITDKSGNYTIFNVPDGDYELEGYAAGLQIESASVTVSGSEVVDNSLDEVDRPTTTVEGNIQIVNAPGGSETSVILVVEATFDADAARGEVPRGLRAPRTGEPDVDGDFSIEGVPDGNYVVLAAWENDALVRDPDTNIAGTDFVTIEVSGGSGTYTVPDSFKVTEALELFGPGAEEPEAVTSAPTLRWADDSSEEWYEVRVFDAFGDEVWSVLDVPGAHGVDEVTLDYEGPLETGMYYQFRVTSWRAPGGGDPAPISATEDLRGVFYRAPNAE